MKIDNSKAQQFLQSYKKKSQPPRDDLNNNVSELPTDKVSIQTKKVERFKVEKNTPSDPQVSTKVLDSLNSGIINFSQEQRDTIATILSNRSKEAIANRQRT